MNDFSSLFLFLMKQNSPGWEAAFSHLGLFCLPMSHVNRMSALYELIRCLLNFYPPTEEAHHRKASN